MQYREIGNTGMQASVVGIGTWQMGGWRWGGSDESEAIKALHAAIDAGINLVDTAPIYGRGRSEEVVGKALRGKRHQVILATKCGMVWHVEKGRFAFEQRGLPIYKYLGPESIRYEVEQSLKRLQTDYIDLYQTHWPDPGTPIAATMQTLLELQREGKIRAIGVSNVSVDQLQEYLQHGSIASAQQLYSMLDREIEADLLPFCQKNSISVLAYSPLAKGLLTGKIGPDRVFNEDDQRRDNPRFSTENRLKIAAMLKAFAPIAESHQISMAQLAIAWTFSQPGLTHVLGGTQKAGQAVENAAAGDVVLSDKEISFMNQTIDKFSLNEAPRS
ncbi:MAG TPA: aldo/keto reductase [Syntrophomonadaceae bacterium]|nr:aldo/keto reductase [Syntrophomonadaceae bacterium]